MAAKRPLVKKRITDITDRDFFRSLNPRFPGLAGVVSAASKEDYASAWKAWAEYFCAMGRPGPFPDPAREVEKLRDDPEGSKKIVLEAERIVRHEIQGWHQSTIRFGRRVDFNADFGESGQYGFHYWGWSRPLLTAWRLTGRRRYVDCFEDLLNQYVEQRNDVVPRIPALHPVWYELGCGAKALVFSDFYAAFGRLGTFSSRSHERAVKLLLSFARWLADCESRGFRKGNWQVCGSYGLLYIARMFPELRHAPGWQRLAFGRLLEHARDDFYPDGGHSERCPGYASWVVSEMQNLHDLTDRMPALAPVKVELSERLAAMYRWFLAMTPPTGEMMAWGDGGYGPAVRVLEAAAHHTRNGRFLWPVCNRLSASARRNLPAPAEPDFSSIDLRPSGYATMRSGWGKDDLFLCVNYGEWGGGHTHCDLLNFDLFGFGTGLALDTARYGAYDNPLNAFFRRATAHNQVVVNDCDFDRRTAKGLDVVWSAQDRADFFAASHEGYRENHKVTLRRSILFVKGEYWFVSDLVTEHQRRHVYTFYLHAPTPWKISSDRRAVTGTRPGLLVVPAYPEEIRQVTQGIIYGRNDAPAGMPYPERHGFGFRKWGPEMGFGSFTFAHVLIPFRRVIPSVKIHPLIVRQGGKPVSRDTAEAFEVRTPAGRDTFVISHAGPARRTYGDVTTDARLAIVRRKGRKMLWARVSGGNFLQAGGLRFASPHV